MIRGGLIGAVVTVAGSVVWSWLDKYRWLRIEPIGVCLPEWDD